MFSDLKRYLESTSSPQLINDILFTYDVLHRHYGDMLLAKVSQQVMIYSNQEKSDSLLQLYQDTLLNLINACKAYGIIINEDVVTNDHLSTLTAILYGLVEYEHYEDKDSIVDILDLGEDELPTFSMIIALLSNVKYTDVLELVERVNYELLERVYQVAVESVNADVEEVGISPSEQLKQFIALKLHSYVDADVLNTFINKPHRLTLRRILRTYGNRLADDKHGVYSWIFVILVAEQPTTPNDLFDVWGKHFLEENDLINMKHQVTTEYNRLFGGQLHE